MNKKVAAGKADNRHPGRKRHFWPGHAKPDDRAIDNSEILRHGLEGVEWRIRGVGIIVHELIPDGQQRIMPIGGELDYVIRSGGWQPTALQRGRGPYNL